MIKNQVVRDPAEDLWRVVFKGRMTAPAFNSRGAAEAYLQMLEKGRRQPEYHV